VYKRQPYNNPNKVVTNKTLAGILLIISEESNTPNIDVDVEGVSFMSEDNMGTR